MSKSRDLGEFPAAALDIDASGNVDVTGTVTADGLTVDGGSGNSLVNFTPSGTFSTVVSFANASSAFDVVSYGSGSASADNFRIRDNGASRLNIAGNGDISFYEDTGTTPKFFWDASAESLGIGTSSPTNPLEVKGSNSIVRFYSDDTATELNIKAPTVNVIGLYSGTADNLVFGTADTERMRIDANGAVGINYTNPSVLGTLTVGQTADGKGIAIADSTQTNTFFLENDGTQCNIRNNDAAPIVFSTNLAERMRIDSSGNVGIGNTTPGNYSAVGANNLVVGANSGNNGVTIVGAAAGYASLAFADSVGTGGTSDYSGLIQYSHIANSMNFFTGSLERLRIDSSGTVMFGKSDSNAAVDGFVIGSPTSGVTASGADGVNNTYHVYKTGAGAGYKFYVSFTGTVNYTALSQLSDEREKKNIVDIPHGLNTIMSLKPRCFDWNGDEEANGVFGFIAQEVETVLPSLIGEYKKDEGVTRKSLSQVELIPVLTKAIQEQQALIEALTARITALEAK